MLKHFGSGPNNDALLGDLAEQYVRKESALWYWRQTMKAIPVSLLREIRTHKRIAARALLTGWGLWVFSLIWFFPFISHYFFSFRVLKPALVSGPWASPFFNVTGLGTSFSRSDPIGSMASLLWMPVGAPLRLIKAGDLFALVFGFGLPLVVAAVCGWLVARFHRDQQTAVVLLFAGSILMTYLLLFGRFAILMGSPAASVLAGPLAAYVAASIVGILMGGGLVRRRERIAEQ